MKQYGLPKEFRLLKRGDFLPKREKARKIQTKNFTIICSEKREGGPRLGIVASRRVGNAVARNRIKRLVREFFRLNRGEMDGTEDIIVIARSKARIGRYSDVKEELKRLL